MIIQAFYKIIIISKKIDKSLKFSCSNKCNINIDNNFQNGINKRTFKSFMLQYISCYRYQANCIYNIFDLNYPI